MEKERMDNSFEKLCSECEYRYRLEGRNGYAIRMRGMKACLNANYKDPGERDWRGRKVASGMRDTFVLCNRRKGREGTNLVPGCECQCDGICVLWGIWNKYQLWVTGKLEVWVEKEWKCVAVADSGRAYLSLFDCLFEPGKHDLPVVDSICLVWLSLVKFSCSG